MKHFTIRQRYALEDKVKEGLSLRAISRHLGKWHSTVSREIQRCNQFDEYDAELAHFDYLNKRHRGRYQKSTQYLTLISKLLMEEQFSPEQIVGRLKYLGYSSCSVETIYQLIYDDKARGGNLYTYLRRRRKKRKARQAVDNRGVLNNRRNIRERPIEADEKSEIGHLEADVVIGTKARSPVLVTLVDRRSGWTLMGKANSKSENDVYKAICKMNERSAFPWKSVTFDNGKEFACHRRVEDTCSTLAYFSDPYSSWQRGLNENTNGLIRQYFPKGKTLENVPESRIQEIENKLNRRPRKRFKYRTPIEFMKNDVNNNEMCCISI